jgi:hypothetical protein
MATTKEIKTRPLLCKTDEVKAIKAGLKRVLCILAPEFKAENNLDTILRLHPNQKGCPLGEVGERLWVREAYRFEYFSGSAGMMGRQSFDYLTSDKDRYFPGNYRYRADERLPELTGGWQPSTRMPRAASRLLLEIVSVRVERVQGLAEATHLAYGGWEYKNCPVHKSPACSFAHLWGSIHGVAGWTPNPWVWVVEFKVIAPAPATPTNQGGPQQ